MFKSLAMTGSITAQRVTVVGTGAIGSAVTHRLLTGGREVTVWNRTAARSAELVEAGAVRAETLAEAASSSELIVLTLTDYAAVQECLAQLHELSGRTIVAMCTGTADNARAAAQHVISAGGRYLDAGIQASPEMIGTAAATILYSGSPEAFKEHLSTLELLSTPRFVGDPPDAAAIWDLALFGVWYDAQLGLLRALHAVGPAGIDVAEFGETAATQLGHVLTAVPTTVSQVRQAEYPPGPADLSEHLTVIQHLIDLRGGSRLGDGGLATVARTIEALIADGHGHEGLSACVRE
jgi:3-hydroxyisobutyrate dehydrogenase-like beta-hydroxyacid dehydrogenase